MARFGAATALAVFALALQATLAIWVEQRVPYLFFIALLALTSAVLGRGPALLVYITGLAYSAVHLAPLGSLAVDGFADRLVLVVYAIVGLAFVLVGGQVRTIMRRAATVELDLLGARLEAQRASNERDALFRVALETSPVPFTILAPVKDASGRIVDFSWSYMNSASAKAIGRPLESLIGRRVGEVLPGSWNEPGLFELYVAVSERGATHAFEQYSSANGIRAWFHIVAAPLNDSVVVWYSDVTAQKREQQALREDGQRKDEFLATLAHELRNPLAPIRQAAALSLLPNATEEQRRWSAQVIERQAANMALLLDDLLDVSRITRGTLGLRKVLAEVRPMIETAIETARPLIDRRQHQFSAKLPAHPVYLEADPLRVGQVVANLLGNAAKFTEPGGNICVAVEETAGEVVITVSDNGIGIRPEKLGDIFGMFAQIKPEDDQVSPGLGIGLALSKGLISLHGGSIDAASDGPGTGSRFTVRLPAATPAPMSAPSDAPRVPPPAAARKVLIADDNRDAADTLAAFARLEGHEVLVAYDGAAALAGFSGFAPDVMLLDVGMPGRSGIDVAQQIRSAPSGQAVTLVAITGWGQSGDRAKTAAAGFDAHLTKPVDLEQIRLLLAGQRSGAKLPA